MLPGSPTPKTATMALQLRLDKQISRAKPLGLQYNPSKGELIHLLPRRIPHRTLKSIVQGNYTIASSETIKLLGIIINNKLSFRQQVAAATTKTQLIRPFLQRIAFPQGASMEWLHHLANTLPSPTLTWGSEVWWTGARHILDNMNPTYLRFASFHHWHSFLYQD